MNKPNPIDDLILCNCDGFWHVSVDGITRYVDTSELLAEVLKVPEMQDDLELQQYRLTAKARNQLRAELRKAYTELFVGKE